MRFIYFFNTTLQKTALYFYFFEIKLRLFYLFFSLLLTFIICYFNSFELIYLFVKPFFASNNFIYTDPTEALSITLKICLIFTFNFLVPLFFYQFWSFFIPSLLKIERKKIRFFIFLCFFLFITGNLLNYFFLLPEISQFLSTFQIKKDFLTIQLEIRIFSYVRFTLYLFIILSLFYQIPLIFLVLFIFKFLTPEKLSKIRKYYLFCSIVISSLISPPEILSQVCLAFFLFFCYEISIWLGFVFQQKEKLENLYCV